MLKAAGKAICTAAGTSSDGKRKRMPGKPPQGRRSAPDSSEYLRRNKPIRVRRDPVNRLRPIASWLFLALVTAGLALASVRSIDYFLDSSPRFRFAADMSGLQVTGLNHVSLNAVEQVFMGDVRVGLGRVPLDRRYRMLLEIPWVGDAYVRRVWPNEIHVHIDEREPVAFVRVQGGEGETEALKLIDAAGVFLDVPPGSGYSLPVSRGITPAMTLGERHLRLGLLDTLVSDLDSAEPAYGSRLSEIDLSDPRNAQVTTVHQQRAVDLQMGDEHFRHRFEIFLTYIDTWIEEYGDIRSVDLRFEGQVAVQPAKR